MASLSLSASVVHGTLVSGLILGLAFSVTFFGFPASGVILPNGPSLDLGAGFDFSGAAFFCLLASGVDLPDIPCLDLGVDPGFS